MATSSSSTAAAAAEAENARAEKLKSRRRRRDRRRTVWRTATAVSRLNWLRSTHTHTHTHTRTDRPSLCASRRVDIRRFSSSSDRDNAATDWMDCQPDHKAIHSLRSDVFSKLTDVLRSVGKSRHILHSDFGQRVSLASSSSSSLS